jgi:hypothetical protein
MSSLNKTTSDPSASKECVGRIEASYVVELEKAMVSCQLFLQLRTYSAFSSMGTLLFYF